MMDYDNNNSVVEKVIHELQNRYPFNVLFQVSPRTRMKIWDTYIGKEIGEHPCMLCGKRNIAQLDFYCGYNIAESKGGATAVENILPICRNCNNKKGTKTFEQYLKSIGKRTWLDLLPAKIQTILGECVLADNELFAHDSAKLARVIATNPVLWEQFLYLKKHKNHGQKIRIGKHYKQIILFI